jgi:hypothetical protein
MKKESIPNRVSVLKLRLSSFVFGLLALAGVWCIAFAITYDILRSFLLVGALALVSVASSQARHLTRIANTIEVMPFIKQFDEEMKDNTVEKSNPLGHAYFDPETGEFKKNK